MNRPQIDPIYDPELLAANMYLRALPLQERELAIASLSQEQLAACNSANAPYPLVQICQAHCSEAITQTLTKYEQGRLQLARGNNTSAINLFTEAVTSGDLLPHHNLATIAHQEKRHQDAKNNLKAVAKSISAKITQSQWLTEANNTKKAITLALKASKQLPQQPIQMQKVFGGQLCRVLARAHSQLGELEGAEYYLLQGANARADSQAAYELASLYMNPNFTGYNPEQALKYYQAAINLGNNQGLIGIAKIQLAFGQDANAQKTLEIAATYGAKLPPQEHLQIIAARKQSSLPN